MTNLKINSSEGSRILFLDYLRVFAFISVLIGHKFYLNALILQDDPNVHGTVRLIIEMTRPLFYGGGAGVVVFFLISGYIITHVLQSEKAGVFIFKRVFRIYPLYIFAVIIQYLWLMHQGYVPDVSTLMLQLLLIGDFFDVPYSLGGVEWTLRVEMLFYFFMTGLRFLNLTDKYKRFLPFVFIFTVVLFSFVDPFPTMESSKGYFSLYFPFLLLGSMFYLFENKQASIYTLLLIVSLTFYNYYLFTPVYQSVWISEHFAIVSFLIFLGVWLYRGALSSSPLILQLADLTYAVYLFHNWFFDFARSVVLKFLTPAPISYVLALVILFVFCHFAVKYIEKPSIKLGRLLLAKWSTRR